MNILSLGLSARRLCALLPFASGLFLLLGSLSAEAQIANSLSQTDSRAARVDGSSLRIFFDFSSSILPTDTQLLHTTVSINFAKVADLSDDPPFYSEIGVVLRKLNGSLATLNEVTLIDTSTFSDGAPGSFFSGTITFDDSAPTIVNINPDQPAPGVFKPVEPLAALGSSYSPFWELDIDDASFQNPLLFRSATLTLFTSVPESGTIGWASGVLLALVVAARQKRRSAD